MRDYLYIWHDAVDQYIVASGIEFREIVDRVGTRGGIVTPLYEAWILEHGERDARSGLSYVPAPYVGELAEEDLYGLGDFCWVDYEGEQFPSLEEDEVAELLFFAHSARPLRRIILPSLDNRFLCYVHDDGWYLKLHYSCWADARALFGGLDSRLDLDGLQVGDHAYWIYEGHVALEERSHDVDSVVNRRTAG